MKTFLLLMTVLNLIFLLMHELDACYEGEWQMIGFLRHLPERTQSLIFLYAHIPIYALVFYYIWHVFQSTGKPLWIVVNAFGLIHFALHWQAKRWKSNVFHRLSSFFFIGGQGVTGLINLLLSSYY